MGLIDRDRLLYFIRRDADIILLEKHTADDIVAMIKTAPTIEAVPVVHGRWIDAEQYVDEDGLRHTQFRCSWCGRYEDEREPYCNCGAKMDGKAV